ncbi:MAG: hypothetical protein ABI200_05095, partial [Gaiellales bacterium]
EDITCADAPDDDELREAITQLETELPIAAARLEDMHWLTVDTAWQLLHELSAAVRLGTRQTIRVDMHRAVGAETFALLGDAAVTIGELSIAAYASLLCRVDVERFVETERDAPYPMLQIIERVIATGFVAARLGPPRPAWLRDALCDALADELPRISFAGSGPGVMSPVVIASLAALTRIGEQWFDQLDDDARTSTQGTYDALALEVLAQLEETPRRERVVPSIADLHDIGYACCLVQELLQECAAEQQLPPPACADALEWLQLIAPESRVRWLPAM